MTGPRLRVGSEGPETMPGDSEVLLAVDRLSKSSLGLAPVLVTRLMDTIAEINQQFGTAALVAEQNMREALRIAQRAVVVHTGRVVLVERAETLGCREDLFSLVIEGQPGSG